MADASEGPSEGGECYRLVLAPSSSAPKLARDFVGLLLRERGRAAFADDARLCVTELVTNAYRHTDTPAIGLDVVMASGATTLYVADDQPWALPVPGRQDLCEVGVGAGPDGDGPGEGGRGMRLVGSLAHAWGMTIHGAHAVGRKHVWCTFVADGGTGVACKWN
ncbi:ATP-binding protein [Streptomyces montanisoli]|uniref:ATP-binding protein n=1 Tax=Streptomyces montanisoli TaxID=2798581 RepID=A0A940RVS4_9ACTN|nr:ATP-binding protein [Streptomyces montanisoli]MBP0458665.1 ATP-binding protein [Streptomyces montanisoli]